MILKKNKNKLWELPGGKKKKNESFYKAALREAEEEIGFLPKFKKTGFICLANKANKLVIYFAKVSAKFSCQLSAEHIDFKWIEFLCPNDLSLSAKSRKLIRYLEKKFS